jgi:hypothetical protein
MTNKLLNNNYKSDEWMFFNKMDHEVYNEKFGIHKFEVNVFGGIN